MSVGRVDFFAPDAARGENLYQPGVENDENEPAISIPAGLKSFMHLKVM
jgi:hypothetical protein